MENRGRGTALPVPQSEMLQEPQERAGDHHWHMHNFRGIIVAHQLQASIDACVMDMEIIARAEEPEDLRYGITFLPL